MKNTMKKPCIVFARVHGGLVDARFWQSYEFLVKTTESTYEVLPAVVERLHVDRARNEIVSMVLNPETFRPPQMPQGADMRYKDATHILFLDDDMLHPPDAALRLMAHKEPIVGGLYFGRQPPHLPIVYRHVQENQWVPITNFCPGLQEVDAVGAGCMLVEVDVFRHLERPWFEFSDKMGEDMYFCSEVQKRGYRILLDADVTCKHLSLMEVGPEHFLTYKERGLSYQEHSKDLKTLSEEVRPYRKDNALAEALLSE